MLNRKSDTELKKEARTIIKEALSKSKTPVIAFSGGKDSTAILHLVRGIKPDVPALFCDTGVESKHTYNYVKTIDNLITVKAETTFWNLVDIHGWPVSKSKAKTRGNACCKVLKEEPAKKWYAENNTDLVFLGLTMAESRNRKLHLLHYGPLFFAKSHCQFRCSPIYNWEVDDVWNYIKSNGFDYNKAYDNGAERVGCQPCTAYLTWKRQLAKENLPMLKRILKMQGQGLIEDYDIAECSGGA